MVGMIYDVNAAADMYENDVEPELKSLEKDMRDISGLPLLKPSSPQQIANLYYDMWMIDHELRYRPAQQNRTFERSVDDAARRIILADEYTSKADRVQVDISKEAYKDTIVAFTKKLDRFKKLGKISSQYIVGLIPHALQDGGHRIYTNLNLHTTETGRLSSTDPNLQNISRPKPNLPDIRSLFLASPGRQIVQADFSQAELRVIAQLSQDAELLRVYENALDLHTEVAQRFYGPNFTTENRQSAKNMNFGVAYRIGAKTFKQHHDIPIREGQKFIDWWWSMFSGVKRWEKEVEKLVHTGEIISPFGRKRRFYLITDENKEALYREAINFYPQSTASDLTLLSAMMIYDRIDRDKAWICLLVHDSIMADVQDDYVEEYKSICSEVMHSVAKIKLNWELPFVADVAHGATWAAAK